MSAYIRCTTSDIQKFLDPVSTIRIDDNYPEGQAQEMENTAARRVDGFLEPGWDVSGCIDVRLVDWTAKLTAADIGASRLGAALAQGTAEWTKRYQNEVYAELSRMIMNHPNVDLPGAAKKSMSLRDRFFAAKTREQGILPNV